MRHRKAGRKFDTNAPHRKAMFRNMVTALMVHGQIKTTTQRAKELRRVADRVISIGKRAPSPSDIDALDGDAQRQARADRVAAIRRARLWVNDADAMDRLFGEYADRFRTRPGGYTRIIKMRNRSGDDAPISVIELMPPGPPETKSRGGRAPMLKSTASVPVTKERFDADKGDDA